MHLVLVSTTRQQFLCQQEVKIRSLAGQLAKSDIVINLHLDAVLSLEEPIDLHEIAFNKFSASQDRKHLATTHQSVLQCLYQHKLYHLDKLAHLTL